MNEAAAATIVAKNRLSLGRVVAESFLHHHPDIPFFLLLADEVEGYFAPEQECFRLVRLTDLAIPDFRRWRFHYAQDELSYAATPFLLSHLLDQGFTHVVFIKQESMVLGDLAVVFDRLQRSTILLTPHLLAPLSGEPGADREVNILLSGVYNGGLLGVSDTDAARRFLAWWQDRLFDHCYRDVAEGLHFEQRWLDLVPAYFEGVHILRDRGVNVGHWNLPERAITLDGDSVLVDGVPCVLFRFSGFDVERPQAATRYSARLTMENIGPAAEVFRRYRGRLIEAGYYKTRAWPYAYGSFDNGVPIPDIARRLYRDLGDENSRFGDPLQTASPDSYFHWLTEGVSCDGQRSGAVPRLWREIYNRRSDVQRAYPNPDGPDCDRFLRWAAEFGANEYGISEDLAPVMQVPGF